MSPSDLHSNTEEYSYTQSDVGYGNGIYPRPNLPFDGDDTTGGYVYHTYTMELLPHELRYLTDGNVVLRFPDRLVPKDNPFYDRISKVYRHSTSWYPAEFDVDLTPGDTLGTDSAYYYAYGERVDSSKTYQIRNYFETHDSAYAGHPANPGMWDVTIGGKTYHAAHHLVDYVRIWDVPKDVYIPNFPQ